MGAKRLHESVRSSHSILKLSGKGLTVGSFSVKVPDCRNFETLSGKLLRRRPHLAK